MAWKAHSTTEKNLPRLGAKRRSAGASQPLRLAVDAGVLLLVVWGLVVVGAERGEWTAALLVALVAGASFWLTDRTGRIGLSRWAVNGGIVLAGMVLVASFLHWRGIRDVLDAAKMLALIQVPLLWERKSSRTRWDLITLSGVQVCLAASVARGLAFGVLLIVYLVLGSCLLGLMCFWREQANSERVSAPDTDADDVPLKTDWNRLRKIALATLIVGPASLFFRFAEKSNGRLPPNGLPPEGPRQGWPPPDCDVPSCAHGPAGVGAGEGSAPVFQQQYWRVLLAVSLAGLLVGAVLFAVLPRWGPLAMGIPRLGALPWRNPAGTRSVGFSDRVELGQLGELMDNPEEVFTAEFRTLASNESYRPDGYVFFRGAVLTDYSNGAWSTGFSSGRRVALPRVEELHAVDHVVRQHIAMASGSHNRVFCVWPVAFLRSSPRLAFDWQQECFERPRELQGRRMEFDLGTTAFENGVQSDLVPATVPIATERLSLWPADRAPSAARLAEQWLAEAALPETDVLGRARLLAQRLRDSGEFAYSKQPLARTPNVDPIEDFLANHRRGHCEYFASALAMMLRSRGIPSRIVVGYKCDEFDHFGRFFRVRHSHAHAWVEAYLKPSQLPAELPGVFNPSDWSHGAWLRLDPTPGTAAGMFHIDGLAQGMRSWIDQLRTFWSMYVVSLDLERQRELIYGPLQTLAQAALQAILSIPGRVADFAAALARMAPLGEPRSWAGWLVRGAVVALVLLLAIVLLVARRQVQRLWRRVVGTFVGRSAPSDPLELYRQAERLLARIGVPRRPWQTQREFACWAGFALRHAAAAFSMETDLAQLVDAFYQVRFGRRPLAETHRRRVQEAYDQLVTGLRQLPRKRT